MNHCLEECTFVIFGATGDLSKRKLLPAMYKLIEDNTLCKFSIIGVALNESTPEQLIAKAKPFISKGKQAIWNRVLENLHYFQMDFHNADAYKKLHNLIKEVEKQNGLPGNRVFYLATMPNHFMDITQHLATNDIAKLTKQKQSPWYRVVYEKPFGNDLASSKKLNQCVSQVFSEKQIYRIDHYLGKEIVGNIALTRFTNTILEPLWNNKYIASVHISLHETLGIEQRGSYYDNYGALKDMVQSHALQLLALTAMEEPSKLDAQQIRSAKAEVLEKVRVEEAIKGQYNGYKQEENIAPSSTTETYVGLKTYVDNSRWQGVPFYITSGKALHKKETSITLVFKQGKCLLTSCPSTPNFLLIKISPDDGMYLGLNTKLPSSMIEVTPITMDFCHSCLFGPNTPEAYETLLTDVVKGDQATFLRADEVEQSWRIIEKAQAKMTTLHTYEKGSKGPAPASAYLSPITI